MKQIHFYALKEDLLPVLEAVERGGPLKYVRMGQSSTPNYESFAHGAGIPNLGNASSDSASSGQSFLVAGRDVPVNVRAINAAGVERYAIDQLVNPDTVTLTPGGIWGEDVVLSGRVATVSNSAPAQELMKRFNSAFKEHFSKVKAFSVGPKAFALLSAGKRLTSSAQSPREYDLPPFLDRKQPIPSGCRRCMVRAPHDVLREMVPSSSTRRQATSNFAARIRLFKS